MTMPNLYPSVGNAKNVEVPWKIVLPNSKANSETYLKEGNKLDTVYCDVKTCPKIGQNWPEPGNNRLIRGKNTSICVDFVLNDMKAHGKYLYKTGYRNIKTSDFIWEATFSFTFGKIYHKNLENKY